MIAGSAVTLVSWPIYATLFRWHGVTGLAIASDIGITLQTLSLAVLLHRRRMVSLASLDYRELGRCLAAGAISGIAVWAATLGVSRWLPVQTRWLDAGELILGSALWLALAGWSLDRLGSGLPRATMRRLGIR
jgi:putative peptidoglycan lipid II flippase